MNIQDFFELSAGKWFAHRTIQDLGANKANEAKSEIIVEKLPATHPDVVKLCEALQVASNSSLVAAKVNWNDTTKLNQKNVGSTVLVLVPSHNNEGKLLRQVSNEDKPSLGQYKLGEDEALSLSFDSGTTSYEERLWFASDNLRMRVNVVKQAGGVNTTSFTTEIRMGVPPAKAPQAASSSASN
jgi:CpeS-like protein